MRHKHHIRLWLVVSTTLMLCLSLPATATEVVDRIVAIVNDDIISLYELNQQILPYLEKIKAQNVSLAQQRRQLFKVREEKLRQLIEEKMADQEIRRLGLRIGDQEIDAAIERIKAVNNYTDDDLRQVLEAQGISTESYRGQIRDQLLRAKLVNREVRSKIVVTAEDVEAYYKSNLTEFGAQRNVYLRNIVKVIPAGADTELKDSIQQQMDAVYEQLQKGQAFETLAQRYSDAPNAGDGGDLGSIPEQMLAPEIRTALADLQPGQFTPVLNTEQGLQIFYLQNLETTDAIPLEEVRERIEEQLYNDIVNRSYQAWIEQLRQKSHIRLIR